MRRDTTGDDVASVASANADEQLSFWSLTLSFMFKLVALGVTLFVLPYNEWIVLRDASLIPEENVNSRIFMRGVSGSDCVREGGVIECALWLETREGKHDDLWSRRLIIPKNIELPCLAYRLVFYTLLAQLALLVLDMGTTLAMCCRYRVTQKRLEKQIAIFCFFCIVLCYIYAIMIVLSGLNDFLHGDSSFKVGLGNAFYLYLAVFMAYNLASGLIFYTEFYRPAANASNELTITQRVYLYMRDLLPLSVAAKYTPANTNDDQ